LRVPRPSSPSTSSETASQLALELGACKTLMGVAEGNSVPDVVVPQLIDLHMQGRFPFDRLVRFYDFDQINAAAADAAAGTTIKPILRIG
jgi:aryl-alcohol dehydrogenase